MFFCLWRGWTDFYVGKCRNRARKIGRGIGRTTGKPIRARGTTAILPTAFRTGMPSFCWKGVTCCVYGGRFTGRNNGGSWRITLRACCCRRLLLRSSGYAVCFTRRATGAKGTFSLRIWLRRNVYCGLMFGPFRFGRSGRLRWTSLLKIVTVRGLAACVLQASGGSWTLLTRLRITFLRWGNGGGFPFCSRSGSLS